MFGFLHVIYKIKLTLFIFFIVETSDFIISKNYTICCCKKTKKSYTSKLLDFLHTCKMQPSQVDFTYRGDPTKVLEETPHVSNHY